MLRFESRLLVLSKINKNTSKSKVGLYPSELEERGCANNGKTCLVVPVMVPRPENAK
jgi:hypothetical protein